MMDWGNVLTSGITAAVVGALAGGIVGYFTGRRLQRKEHEYQEEQERKRSAEAEGQRLRSIALNRTQEDMLDFCRAHPSERYSLEGSSGTYWLFSVDTGEKKEFPDMTMRRQVEDMISKGYLNPLGDRGAWFIFELTEQSRTHEI